MPKYVDVEPKVTRREVPDDLPDPAGELKKGVKPGSVIESDELGPNGKPRRFRLQDKRVIPALWREIGRPTNVVAESEPTEPDEDEEDDTEEEEDEEDDEEDDDTPPPPAVTKRRTTITNVRRRTR